MRARGCLAFVVTLYIVAHTQSCLFGIHSRSKTYQQEMFLGSETSISRAL